MTRDEDGTWRIRLGARVRVHITVSSAGPCYHVGVIDPLPAGPEAVNPALAGTAGLFVPAVQDVTPPGVQRRFPTQLVNVRPDPIRSLNDTTPTGYHRAYLSGASVHAWRFRRARATRRGDVFTGDAWTGAAARVLIEDRAAAFADGAERASSSRERFEPHSLTAVVAIRGGPLVRRVPVHK